MALLTDLTTLQSFSFAEMDLVLKTAIIHLVMDLSLHESTMACSIDLTLTLLIAPSMTRKVASGNCLLWMELSTVLTTA